VIFADGCFFHGCPKHYRAPLSNTEYWTPKITGNIARDKAQQGALEANGWSVWRVWEHELTKSTFAGTQMMLGRRLDDLAQKHRRPRSAAKR
jgi:G:T-mismatch repair DNA endonuclease (very short patch repair protein)